MTSKQPRWSAVRSDLRFEFVGPNCICYNAVWTVLGLFGTNGRKKEERKKEERIFSSTRVDGFAATNKNTSFLSRLHFLGTGFPPKEARGKEGSVFTTSLLTD